MNREFLIGIELSQSEIRGGLVDLNGKVVKKITIPTEARKGKKKVVDNLAAAINRLKKEDIIGVGIAIPGFVDQKKGLVIETDIPGFSNVPLKQMLFDLLHIPIFLENLPNCLVLAEHRISYARKMKHLVNLNIADSVSLGIVVNSRLYRGAGNIVGRIGHTQIAEKGRCECGNLGCLDNYASEGAIIANYKRLSRKGKSIPEISEAAKKDKNAKKVVADAAKCIGIALSSIINLIDPEMIIISGAAAKMEGFLEGVRREVEKRVHEGPAKRLTVVASDLEDAAILGASSIIMSGEIE